MIRRRAFLAALVLLLLAFAAPAARAAELWVDGGNAFCSDARATAQVASAATPWCTLGPAGAPGPSPATPSTCSPPPTAARCARSAPVARLADPLRRRRAGRGARRRRRRQRRQADRRHRRHARRPGDPGGAAQGVWIDGRAASHPDPARRRAPTPAPGFRSRRRAVCASRTRRSTATGCGDPRAGRHDGRALHARHVTGNGLGGGTYDGDGIQLGGSGALVADSTIAGNGDPGPYEHGVYAAASSSGWTLERNELRDNGGANVKAAGGPGRSAATT